MQPPMGRDRQSVIIDIDPDVAEAIIRVGDYVPPLDRTAFISAILSLLLVGLLIEEDAVEHVMSGIDRIMINIDVDNLASQRLWGELISINRMFRLRLLHHIVILEELEKLLPSDLREHAEDLFYVEFSNCGNFLRVL